MAAFEYFSKNGQILPMEQAVIPVSNIEYSYGFGVYESMKVRGGIAYFVDQHIERLFSSADIIGITHPFTQENIKQYIRDLLQKLTLDACNIKILLIGGREPLLFIIPLAPLFPDRKLYSQGAKVITVQYERPFPHAKALNMLQSYVAYKKAKENDCYDALLVNKEGNILEGTRTNFFVIKGRTLLTPPKEHVLEGVALKTVILAAQKNGFIVQETEISPSSLNSYDGAFLTSTSSKIMPIRQIDDFVFSSIPESLRELMHLYDAFLDESNGILV
jgi:branched-chain amino acid aminotransferase